MIRVVLVDDHPVVREGLGALIAGQPDLDVVGVAPDGRAVPEIVARTRPDVVVTDLRMPDGQGVDLLTELRRHVPELPLMVLSTFGGPADVASALDAGATSFVLKDAGREEVFAAIRDTARGRSVLSPAVTAELLRSRRASAGPSPREREILLLVASGRTNQQIARHLRVSEATVKTHLAHLYAKLDSPDRASAVAAAIRRGWIDLQEP